MNYLELTIDLDPVQPFAEIITVQLAQAGFDSFVDTDTGIIAYGETSKTSMERAMNETLLGEQRTDVTTHISSNIIENQNWNALWESNFDPIFIGEELSILAPFHDQSKGKGIVVEIQPQMSFGTGHHPTTYMMLQMLTELKINPNHVLDMGTGTGVLAIVSEKLYPNSKITAIDVEENAVQNAIENVQRNKCKKVNILLGDAKTIPSIQFDLILANINKNTLKEHLPVYAQQLNPTGTLLLSGFFETDVEDLYAIAENHALQLRRKIVSNTDSWACIQLVRR